MPPSAFFLSRPPFHPFHPTPRISLRPRSISAFSLCPRSICCMPLLFVLVLPACQHFFFVATVCIWLIPHSLTVNSIHWLTSRKYAEKEIASTEKISNKIYIWSEFLRKIPCSPPFNNNKKKKNKRAYPNGSIREATRPFNGGERGNGNVEVDGFQRSELTRALFRKARNVLRANDKLNVSPFSGGIFEKKFFLFFRPLRSDVLSARVTTFLERKNKFLPCFLSQRSSTSRCTCCFTCFCNLHASKKDFE